MDELELGVALAPDELAGVDGDDDVEEKDRIAFDRAKSATIFSPKGRLRGPEDQGTC